MKTESFPILTQWLAVHQCLKRRFRNQRHWKPVKEGVKKKKSTLFLEHGLQSSLFFSKLPLSKCIYILTFFTSHSFCRNTCTQANKAVHKYSCCFQGVSVCHNSLNSEGLSKGEEILSSFERIWNNSLVLYLCHVCNNSTMWWKTNTVVLVIFAENEI